MKASLESVISKWLSEMDTHPDRPDGLACEDLAEMMANAAASVYDASHAGAVMGADSV
jgi:hypothetical protein